MYLYFDNKGTLLETINDEALRQYNKGVNTVNVFIEDAENPDSGMIPWNIVALKYWFQLVDGDVLQKVDYELKRDKTTLKSVPFDRNRDLKYFQYGKVYEFFVIEVPCGEISELSKSDNTIEFVTDNDVFRRGGLVLMTMQAGKIETKGDTTISRWLSLERVSFTVEDAVLLPDSAVNSSEFNWLLQQYIIGDYLRPQLVYGAIDKIQDGHTFNTEGDNQVINLPLSNFNRAPIIGDKFLYIYNQSSFSIGSGLTQEVIITMASILSFNDDNTVKIGVAPFSGFDIKGDKGDRGISVFCCQRVIQITGPISVGKEIDVDISDINQGLTTQDVVLLPFENATIDYLGWCSVPNIDTSTARLRIKGYQRLTGERGATFTPKVSTDGTLSWTNDGKLSNPTPVNIMGPQGKQGIQGVKGATGAKIVSTELFSSTTVDDTYKQTFDDGTIQYFTVRRGIKGATFIPSVSEYGILSWENDGGLTNPQAKNITGPMGAIFTPQVSANGDISWTNNGNLENPATVNIMGPRGYQGIQGEIGPDALVCKEAVQSYYEPQSNYLMIPSFNRTPKTNEVFQLLWSEYSNTYMCLAKVTKIENNRVDFDILSSYLLTGPIGKTGNKGDKGDNGVGISNIRVQGSQISEEYTMTNVSVTLTDGNVAPLEIKAKNGITPNSIAYVGSVDSSAWISSSTYSKYGYEYQAIIQKYNRTDIVYDFDTYVPEVIPTDIEDIIGDNFAPFAETVSSGVRIYAKQKPSVTKTFNIALVHANSKA